jgi:hypothetical protein
MQTLKDLVVYHCSHFLRGKNPKLHAERLQHFLATCTTALQVLELSIQVRTGPGYDLSHGQMLIKEFTARWGEPEITAEGGGSDGIQFAHCWPPSELDLDQALALLSPMFSSDSHQLPMLSVSVRVQFQLADAGSRSAFPGQNWNLANYHEDFFFLPHGYSEIWAEFGESSALGALISFPFAANDPKLLSYLAFFQRHFPTSLSTATKHWHWWIVRKDGGRHFRRSAVPALGGTQALKSHLLRAKQ